MERPSLVPTAAKSSDLVAVERPKKSVSSCGTGFQEVPPSLNNSVTCIVTMTKKWVGKLILKIHTDGLKILLKRGYTPAAALGNPHDPEEQGKVS